jgi:hypothetical protein
MDTDFMMYDYIENLHIPIVKQQNLMRNQLRLNKEFSADNVIGTFVRDTSQTYIQRDPGNNRSFVGRFHRNSWLPYPKEGELSNCTAVPDDLFMRSRKNEYRGMSLVAYLNFSEDHLLPYLDLYYLPWKCAYYRIYIRYDFHLLLPDKCIKSMFEI